MKIILKKFIPIFSFILVFTIFPDPCRSEMLLFEKTYVRGQGQPEVITDAFDVPSSIWWLRVELHPQSNLEEIEGKISITLNRELLKVNSGSSSDVFLFGKNRKKEQNIKLFKAIDGRNEVKVALRGEKGALMRVVIIGVPAPPEFQFSDKGSR